MLISERRSPMANSKFGNKKVMVDGIKFDSKAESLYYRKLKRQGMSFLAVDSTYCAMQERITLQDSFMLNGKRIPPIVYKADFVIYKDGNVVKVIDVKGFQDAISKLKMKMFANRYGFPVIFAKLDRKTNQFVEMTSFESATQQGQRQRERAKKGK